MFPCGMARCSVLLLLLQAVVIPFSPTVASPTQHDPDPEPPADLVLVMRRSRLQQHEVALGGTRVLRRTSNLPVAGPAAWDESRTSGFVTWTEDGDDDEGEAPGERRWGSFTVDRGLQWSEARRVNTALSLRHGTSLPGQAMPVPGRGTLNKSRGDSKVFIVQFYFVSTEEFRAGVAQAAGPGGKILHYVPNNAHTVKIPSPAGVQAVERLDYVERVEVLQPGFRVDPNLLAWVESDDDEEQVRRNRHRRHAHETTKKVRVVASESGDDGKSAIAAAASAAGAIVHRDTMGKGRSFEITVHNKAQLVKLAEHDETMWIDEASDLEEDMDKVRVDSGTKWAEDNNVIDLCTSTDVVRGEVMDGGIYDTHQDFGTSNLIVRGTNTPSDHGTACYGIVFGDGTGVSAARGHIPCAQGIAADYSYIGNRYTSTQDLINNYKASFQSNSWGNSRTRSYTSISYDMDEIIFELDIAILQSQSNAGNQDSRPQAWAKNIISVGGIRHYNTLSTSDDAWASGASIGPAADGRIKPDLCYWYDSIYTTGYGNSGLGYTTGFGGTSAATPEVAGVLGVIVQMWADNVWNTNPVGATVFDRKPHASTIKALLVNSANQYTFSGTGDDLTRVHQGWGRPNAQVAKERAAKSFVVDEADVLTLGQTNSYFVSVAAGEADLRVTMVYPDPPLSPVSGLPHRVNSLSLKVTSPSGTVYHGNNGLSSAMWSTAGGDRNDIDTVENVFVQTPEVGQWSVAVTAHLINADGYLATTGTDDAVYALVVTGATESGGTTSPPTATTSPSQSQAPTTIPSATPTSIPTELPTALPTSMPTDLPTALPTSMPSQSRAPTMIPTDLPTVMPSDSCGNGICEGGAGENCNTCPVDCSSSGGASCGDGVCQIGDGENCNNCAADCPGKSDGNPSRRFCCGIDTDCNDSAARCGPSPGACLQQASVLTCCGDSNCDLGETPCNCPTDCGSPPASEGQCNDGVDNDCDGFLDCDDSDCSSDPACQCLPTNAECSFDNQCCNGNCKGNNRCN